MILLQFRRHTNEFLQVGQLIIVAIAKFDSVFVVDFFSTFNYLSVNFDFIGFLKKKNQHAFSDRKLYRQINITMQCKCKKKVKKVAQF